MSDQEWYLEGSARPSLRTWAFGQMALGAAYAGCVLVAIMAFMMILYAVGTLLPEDSKQAPPPMPAIETPFGAAPSE